MFVAPLFTSEATMSKRSGLFVNLGPLGDAVLHIEDRVVAALALRDVYVAPFVECMKASIGDADRLPLRMEYLRCEAGG